MPVLLQLPTGAFQWKTYYEKWAAAIAAHCLEAGHLSRAELDAVLGGDTAASAPSQLYGPRPHHHYTHAPFS